MKNTIVSYSSLKGEIKKAFRNWLSDHDPSLISFPFKGRHMKGYVFDYQACKYLVIMYLAGDTSEALDLTYLHEEF